LFDLSVALVVILVSGGDEEYDIAASEDARPTHAALTAFCSGGSLMNQFVVSVQLS